MKQGLVSVIILFDNFHSDLKICIESIINQSYSDKELILAGNEHDINTVRPLVGVNTESVITVIASNPKSALSKSLEKASGEFFTIIPAGDWFSPDFLSLMVESAVQNSSSIVRSGYFSMRERDMVLVGPHPEYISTEGLHGFSELYRAELKEDVLSGHTKSTKISSVSRAAYFHMEACVDTKTLGDRIKEYWGWGMNRLHEITIIGSRKKNSLKLKELKDKYKGKRCFIIGNGPSLRMEDLDLLKNEYTFAANKVNRAFDKTVWRPTFYSITDFKLLEDYVAEIPSIEAQYKFFPVEEKRYLKKISDNTILFYNKSAFYNGNPPNFSLDPSDCIYSGGTVMYACIQLAVYFGFTEIYFLGIDNTFKVARTKEGFKFDGSVEYFTNSYHQEGHTINYARPDIIDDAFDYAKTILEEQGVKAYNATRGGRLEVFPRVDFDSLFQKDDSE